jgi:hypothetical protein
MISWKFDICPNVQCVTNLSLRLVICRPTRRQHSVQCVTNLLLRMVICPLTLSRHLAAEGAAGSPGRRQEVSQCAVCDKSLNAAGNLPTHQAVSPPRWDRVQCKTILSHGWTQKKGRAASGPKRKRRAHAQCGKYTGWRISPDGRTHTRIHGSLHYRVGFSDQIPRSDLWLLGRPPIVSWPFRE